MATQTKAEQGADSISGHAGELGYGSRQPILNRHGKTHGYELQFRHAPGGADGAASVASVGHAQGALLDATVVLGLEHLSAGLPVFVPCAPDLLTEEWMRVLPANITVLELPGDVEATPALLAACRDLKMSGYRLAMADFTGKQESWLLADLADYVKIDIAQVDAAGCKSIFRRLVGSPTCPIATHVETQEQYAAAVEEGFELFQGYYFCHPEPLKNHRIPGNRLVHLEILEDLQNDPVDMNRLSQLVKCDPGLTFRLLRLVNSPMGAMRQEVTSIQTALMLIGESTFRRIAMLAIAEDFNAEQPAEILRMAFERGRFCELAAGLCGLEPSEQYLIGMVSMFPAMLRILPGDLIKLLPLRAAAQDALMGKGNREGVLLRWRELEEGGDWKLCDALVAAEGLDHAHIMRCHADSIAWANAALK